MFKVVTSPASACDIASTGADFVCFSPLLGSMAVASEKLENLQKDGDDGDLELGLPRQARPGRKAEQYGNEVRMEGGAIPRQIPTMTASCR